jgi:phospholipid-binding lipoprotein MlaA
MTLRNRLLAVVWCCLVVAAGVAGLPPVPDLHAAEAELDDEDLAFLENEMPPEELVSVWDPLESFNRDMFALNDTFYVAILRPVTRGYRFVVPSDVRIPIRNFFDNLMAPVRIANCLLQAKWRAAGGEVGAFFINSTAGVFGFGDPAQRYPAFNPPEEDMGQTLAVWGVPNGPFLVIPLLGFYTARDFGGWLGDTYFDPLFYTAMNWEIVVGRLAVKTVNNTSFRLGDYEAVKAAAIDPYIAFRSGYVQFRQKKVQE